MAPGRNKDKIKKLRVREHNSTFMGKQAHMGRAAGLSKKSPYGGCGGNTGA